MKLSRSGPFSIRASGCPVRSASRLFRRWRWYGISRAWINGLDLPAVVTLLAAEQPMFVHEAPQSRLRTDPCANDGRYELTLAA